MRSVGRFAADAAGLRAAFSVPGTLELGFIRVVCGSEMVRSDGTLRARSTSGAKPGIASEPELGGSMGVLASDDSSTEPGEAGLLSSSYSFGLAGA